MEMIVHIVLVLTLAFNKTVTKICLIYRTKIQFVPNMIRTNSA